MTLRTKELRTLAGCDARAGAPLGAALQAAADLIDAMCSDFDAIRRDTMRPRGEQGYRDAVTFAYATARKYTR